MGLFDKFKKKKEDDANGSLMVTEQENIVEAAPQVAEAPAPVEGNQATVSEVSVDSNPFVEETPVVEEVKEVTPEAPSFDNIFNADPGSLIMPELSSSTPAEVQPVDEMQIQNVNEAEPKLGDVDQTAAVVDNPMPKMLWNLYLRKMK